MGSFKGALMHEKGLIVDKAGWAEQAGRTANMKALPGRGPRCFQEHPMCPLGEGCLREPPRRRRSCDCYQKPQLRGGLAVTRLLVCPMVTTRFPLSDLSQDWPRSEK